MSKLLEDLMIGSENESAQSTPRCPLKLSHQNPSELCRLRDRAGILQPLTIGDGRVFPRLQSLDHVIGPPRIVPARGPPLCDGHDAVVEAAADADPQWDPSAQSAPENQVDQRINW